MVDTSLFAELVDSAREVGDVIPVPSSETAAILDQISTGFIVDSTLVRWWTSLKGPSQTYPYGNADGLKLLQSLIESEEPAYLVITDDDAPPWTMFYGRVALLIQVLRISRFFEFFIVSAAMSWIIFDTHHNELVRAEGTVKNGL